MKIMCNLITGEIRNLAKQINKSDSYTCNLVSVWQTKNGTTQYPTATQLNELLKTNKEEVLDVYFAMPNYEAKEFNANEVPITHVGPTVYLMKLPEQNPMEHFYNMFKNIPELRDLVKTPNEAYKFILWREMAFMQRGLNKQVENRPVVENDALNKMKEWRKRHPLTDKVADVNQKEEKKEGVIGSIQFYSGKISPDANTIFVFGSNPEGRHGVGAAKTAKDEFGAIYGQGEGLQGNAYALPTKDLRVKENESLRSISPEQITENIRKMYEVARQNPDKQFKVAYTNKENEKTLNGYTGKEMSQMFLNAGPIPSNVIFSENWKSFMTEQNPQEQTQQDKTVTSVHNLPQIGTEAIKIDTTNPMVKLANSFTSIERKDRIDMLARNFSKIVDKGVQEKVKEIADAIIEESKKENPNEDEISRLKEKAELFDDAVLGRRAVIQEMTLQQIFDRMHKQIEDYVAIPIEELDEAYGEGRGEYMHKAYQKVLDNWEALLEEACISIEGLENMRIIIDKGSYYKDGKVTQEINGTTDITTDEATRDEEETDDDDSGKRADGNLGWSFRARFTDPITTLSRVTKSILYNLPDTDATGKPKVDDLGNIKYLNGEYAHAVLINELSGLINSDDFATKNDDGTYNFPALNKVLNKYSWINSIINTLHTDPFAVSAFYADFRKDFIPYWIQYFDVTQNKWVTHQLNKANAIDSTKNRITINYEHGNILDVDSIYNAGKEISTDKANIGLNLANNIISLLREFDSSDYDTITTNTAKALRMVGLDADKTVISNLLKSPEGIDGLRKTAQALRNIFDGIKNMSDGSHLVTEFSDDYNTIAREVGLVSELDNVSSFRIGKNTRYSYSSPNYLDTMFKIFKDNNKRDAYLQEQFGKYWWFKENGEWKNEWLRLIETDEDVRDQIVFKELPEINGVEYEDWKPTQIKAAFIREYFSVGKNKGSKKQFAYYNLPIFSDSPVVKFIKFLRYTSDNEGTFKDKMLPLFNQIVNQELTRIKKVRERIQSGATPIVNFDENGLKFCFFPELNKGKYKNFLSEAENLTEAKDLKGLDELINNAISDIMYNNFIEFLNTNLNSETVDEIRDNLISEGVITEDSQLESALEEYFWNQAFATSQIIQLTTTDLAYYKDGTDFQKRYKEVYAPGIKLFTNSNYGRKIEKTLYLTDQNITSSRFADIRASLDRAVKLGHIKSFDRDNILNKFKDINVADAQAYRSLSSMRAILDMIGAWTPEMQQAMDRFKKDQWNMADFNIVWQTIKPFMFTQIEKRDGLGGSIKVPHQNKNSEFLLLSMYQMVASATGKSSKLKAINRFMEDKGIDVIQFESAVKVGKEGVIDISYSEPKLQAWKNKKEWQDIEKAASAAHSDNDDFSIFKAGNDYLLDHNKITQEEYNARFESIEPDEEEVYKTLEKFSIENGQFKPDVIHELPYEDYIIQQPTPEHLFDNIAVFGSQFRNLLISDMPDDPNFRVKVNGKELTKQQVLDLYQANIVENLLEDWRKVKGKFANIETLQEAIFAAIKGNPKYGRDMITALQIVEITNPDTGEKQKVFNIPLDNPSTTNKIQEITTAMFKNSIAKQTIKGASCILVSDFGLTDELQIEYGEDGSIQGIQCYLPAFSKKLYQSLMVTKRTSKGEEYQELDINKLPLDLRKVIGYRIPTEDKYSMAPLIIKGFLPQQNGSAIMLPADITQIAGSDFDVDKMFLMIPEFKVLRYNMKKARQDFAAMNEQFKQVMSLFSNSQLAEDLSNADTNDFKEWFADNKDKYEYDRPVIKKIYYDTNKSPQEQSREARNNMLIDIAWGILTHPDTAEKINNPGNFDKAKVAARIATIVSDPTLLRIFAEKYKVTGNTDKLADVILKLSKEGNLEALNDFIKKYKKERSQLTVDTFIYNHKQNMTGAALIGMYAINTSMQAKYQQTSLGIKDEFTFTINGKKIQSLHDIFSQDGERISKNCANFSAASVDNVKDPVLADLMQNRNTAKVAGFMLRSGMSVEEIGLLFSQPIIRKCIETTEGLDALNYRIRNAISELKELGSTFANNNAFLKHEFTSKELLTNILNKHNENLSKEEAKESLRNEIYAAQLMLHIAQIADKLNDLSKLSRSDSPNSAIKSSLAKAKNQVRELDRYLSLANRKDFPLVGINDSIKNNLITEDMSIDQMREKLLKCKMPMLQAFYSLGIELAGKAMSNYYSQTNDYSEAMLDSMYDNSANGYIPDNLVTDFYNELIEFALSKTKLFGDDGNTTFDEKRDYYLYDFPSELMKIIADNPDIAKINAIKKLQVKNGNILMINSGKLTPLMKESLMLDFDRLLFDESNPAAQKLAIDLLMYSYYKNGLKFGPNNFGTFFSSNFLASFPELINTLRSLKFNMHENSYFDKFLPQFYANHWQNSGLVYNVSDNADVIRSKDGTIAINSKSCLNKNLLYKGIVKSHSLVIYEGQLYSLMADGSGRAVYMPAAVLSSEQKNNRVKYNANMSATDMANVVTDSSRIKNNVNVNPSTIMFDEAMISEDNDQLSGIDDSLYAALAGFTASDYDMLEGQSQLETPLCD